ncbi:hypothetical protein [Rhodoblastus sp.]|jgi:hypothetical protein|uniref:hypothetical protein n=1 Tax=Rhodoblastus sp. TaxID=1962975 RepID=UPI0025E00395|nr:hypothetical protein [Rhodoblastus sp.]
MGSTSDADAVEQPDDAVEYLDVQEALAMIHALSADEKAKLIAMDKGQIGGTGRQAGELFREALCRTILGKRRCPRDVPFIAFLIQTMRSIASHDREYQKRHVAFDDDRANPEPVVLGTGALASSSLNPEQLLLDAEEPEAKTALETINSHFDGDEDCQMMIMGLAEGLRGRDLREFVGADQSRIDYLYKKIRRKMLKLYPYGWQQ